MKTFDFTEVKQLLSSRKQIFLTAHSNPDGDALGAILAIFHFLKRAGHEVNMMVPNTFPDFLSWLPGQEEILIFEKSPEVCNRLFEKSDILFSLDYNSPERIGPAESSFKNSSAIKILVDHHIKPNLEVYDYCYSMVETSSTSEIVYEFMEYLDPKLIDKSMAECIFAGIMTDTGSFSYNCNFARTFEIVAQLINLGIDVAKINRLIYSTNTEDRLRLLGFSLYEKLTVLPDYQTAYISLSKNELLEFNYKMGDTEGLVNYALSIEGVRFAAFFAEREDKIRTSFRSVGEFSVNEFARTHFLGGGHKNAAGGDSFENMEETIERFLRLLPEYKKELTS